MPAPPARRRSARVPCGLNSSSSSPARNWRSNSLFSPTYEEIIFLIWRVSSSWPRPKPSTPALLEITVRPLTPESRSAAISASGMPQWPKPPTARVWLSATMPERASSALVNIRVPAMAVPPRKLSVYPAAPRPPPALSGSVGLSAERYVQFRQDREEIAHQPDVRHLEDRRVGVLVDRNDRAGVLDAGEVLDRAADADGDVQFGGDDLAGLADLQLVRDIAGVHRCARGADRGAEPVGKLVDDVEVLLRADPATAGDDPLGALQVRTVGLARGQPDEARVLGQVGVHRSRFDRRAAAAAGFRPGRRAHGGDHGLLGRSLHGHDGVAGVDRPLEFVSALDGHQVGDLRHA